MNRPQKPQCGRASVGIGTTTGQTVSASIEPVGPFRAVRRDRIVHLASSFGRFTQRTCCRCNLHISCSLPYVLLDTGRDEGFVFQPEVAWRLPHDQRFTDRYPYLG